MKRDDIWKAWRMIYLYRNRALSALFFSVFVLCGISAYGEPSDQALRKSSPIHFKQRTIALDDVRHLTLLTGSFLGSDKLDLAFVTVDQQKAASLNLYAFEKDEWTLKHKVRLEQSAIFVDVANIAGEDRIIFADNQTIRFFDPATGSFTVLLKDIPVYQTENRIPAMEVSRDLNGDGLDELLIAGAEEVNVYVQDAGGGFLHPLTLGPFKPFQNSNSSKDHSGTEVPSLRLGTLPWCLNRVQSLDFNQDGKMDMVFLHPDRFDIHLQNEQGQFASEPLKIVSKAGFHPDSLTSRMSEQKGNPFWGHFLGWKARTRWVSFFSFSDLNGDGLPDFVTLTEEGRSFIKMRTSIGVHLGELSGGTVQFGAEPDNTFQAQEAHPLDYAINQSVDLDQDGKAEWVITTVDAGLGDMFEALIASSIDLHLEVFQQQHGSFEKESVVKRKIQPKSHFPNDRGPFFPVLLLGDCNGDGRIDLLSGHDWDELHIFEGVSAPDYFSKTPIKIKVNQPDNERHARLVDLNRDGKQDLLVYRHLKDEGWEASILIAD